MDFSAARQAYKFSISWHKRSKTQHFMNYWCFGLWKPVFLHFIRQEYFNKIKKNQGTSWENIIYGNMIIEIFEMFEISETLGVHFLNFWNSEFLIFDNYNMIILWNHEKSKTRNFLRFILPAEFPQKLEYEFSFDQKTWNMLSIGS